jgi:hypothetical protein
MLNRFATVDRLIDPGVRGSGGSQRANHRVTEHTENGGSIRIVEQCLLTKTVKHMALQLRFVFSVFSVTRWLENNPAKQV